MKSMENEIRDLHPEAVLDVFNELEEWNKTGVLGTDTITRRIINRNLKNDPLSNLLSSGIAFQMVFYRFLATKYINQKTL